MKNPVPAVLSSLILTVVGFAIGQILKNLGRSRAVLAKIGISARLSTSTKFGGQRFAVNEADIGRGFFHLLFAVVLHALFHHINHRRVMAGRSSLRASPNVSQCKSSNSPLAFHFFGVGVNELVIDHEKARIETPRAISGRDGAGDEIHLVERRLNAVVKIALPHLIASAQALFGWATDNQAGFFIGFTNGGQRQPAQFIVADGFAGFFSKPFITGALRFFGTCRRWSIRSRRPPGKTNLLGMNLCVAARLPIRIFGCLAWRTTINVAASRGRTALALSSRYSPGLAGVFPYLLILLF